MPAGPGTVVTTPVPSVPKQSFTLAICDSLKPPMPVKVKVSEFWMKGNCEPPKLTLVPSNVPAATIP